MFFWKVERDPFADARSSRKSIPIFLTLLLAGLIFYGVTELFYLLYDKFYEYIKNQVAYMRIDPDAAIFYDLDLIIRSGIFIVFVLFAFLYVRFLEGRKLTTTGLRKSGVLRGILYGVLSGAVFFFALIGMIAFSGNFALGGEIHTDFITRLAGMISVLAAGVSFEIYFRGFVFSSLGARSRLLPAVLLTCVLSTAAHCFFWGYSVISLVNNFLFDIFLCLIAARTRSVWSACATRAVFLFFCHFVFGIEYSGLTFVHALAPCAVNYSSLWVGTANGIDAGYAFFAFVLLALAFVVLIPAKIRDDDETQDAPYFKHIPVAPEEKPSAVSTEISQDEPVIPRSDDDDWEEEEER